MTHSDSDRKKLVTGIFNRAAEAYGHLPYFLPLGRRLVEVAQIAPGEHVLEQPDGVHYLLTSID